MEILLVFLSVAGLLAAWLVPALRGASWQADSLQLALVQLVECEIPDAYLTIRPKYSPHKFIQYSRYKLDSGLPGLELAFPYARWSEDYFPRVVSTASEQGISYEVQDDAHPGLRFVFVRFGDSTSEAAKFGKSILNDIFGFDDQYRFRVRIN